MSNDQHARDLTRMWERAQRERRSMIVMATLPSGYHVGGYVTGHGSLYGIKDPETGEFTEDVRPDWIHYAMLGPVQPIDSRGDHEYIAGILGNLSADDVAAFTTAYSRVTGDWGGADDDRYEALAHLLRLANTIGRRQADPATGYLD